MDSEIQLGSEENIIKEEDDSNQFDDKKGSNLTWNCIYHIFDIFVALSLMCWIYCLTPKSVDVFSETNKVSWTNFISRVVLTLYLAAFSIIILIYTFYYPFKTKSIYFNFYTRGLYYIFIGNVILLISTLSTAQSLHISPIELYDYTVYTSYYIICVGTLHIISSIITNKKCGTHYCFLPSPFCQLKHGSKLHFKMESIHNIEKDMHTHLQFNENISNTDKSEDDDDQDIDALLAIRKELRSLEMEPTAHKTTSSEPNTVIQKAHTINIEMWQQKINDDHKEHKPIEIARKSMNDIKKTKRKPKAIKPAINKQHTLEEPPIRATRKRAFSDAVVTSGTKQYTSTSFRERLSIFKDNAQALQPTDKINKIKNERKETDKDMKQDVISKRRATIALQTYATSAAAHSQDINLVNKSLKNITKSNCLEKMRDIALLYAIYVPINEYQRWDIRSKLDKMLRDEDLKEEDRDVINGIRKSNTKEYQKMYVLNLRNNVLLTKISKEQKKDLNELITYVIKTAPNIYIMDFTRSNTNKAMLHIIFEALQHRLNDKSKFGPEEIFLDSNPITDEASKVIHSYVLNNPPHLRVLRLTNSFSTIGTQSIVSFCNAMENNHFIIKFSLDITFLMYRNRMDGYLKRNNNEWRHNKKSDPSNMIRRQSYELKRKGVHRKRRSSLPDLHKAHPSLFNIPKQFVADEKKEDDKDTLKPRKTRNRGKSSPPKPNEDVLESAKRRNSTNVAPKISQHKKRRSSVPDNVLSLKDRINKFSK